MSGGFNMDDYVDVAERINSFYQRFPEGSLQSGIQPHVMEIAGKTFVVYHALAYRTPDDPLPAHGWAWEPVPGPTQFTKDSELMNAETAAWGRAIVALGFATKKIASKQEVRARTEPAATADTSEREAKLLDKIEAKGGDVEAAKAAMENARGPQFLDWLAFQEKHWATQTPFVAPTGAAA